MRDHRRLLVWQKAHRLLRDIEAAWSAAPRPRFPGLRDQVLRAAASVPTNIVEGCGTESPIEFARFLDIALKSNKELEYLVQRMHETRMIGEARYRSLDDGVTEVRKMLFAYRAAIRREPRRASGEQ